MHTCYLCKVPLFDLCSLFFPLVLLNVSLLFVEHLLILLGQIFQFTLCFICPTLELFICLMSCVFFREEC